MPRKFGLKSIDLTLSSEHEGFHALSKCAQSVGHSNIIDAERKGGAASAAINQNSDALVAKRKSKAMAIATKPGNQLAMNAFMLWMSGKNLNIFSINTTTSAVLTPMTNIFKVESVFGNLDTDTQVPKLIFVALNVVWLGIGLYKMSSLRLLPTTAADFMESVVWKEMSETSSIPPMF
ncbi:unnamed protein product [Cylindrotheca closterium]|uniref:ER membrane protein complex subunit 4 n=1 Tax=Cylindrotheca closterium TaxID=2856 RepID=A0AAD2FL86_9STRA|nr:unnamed protein product [Cylindrotheca closterium]